MKTVEQGVAEARAVRVLRALASPARFRVVQLLAERKECTTAQLAEAVSLAPSSLFEHLAALREAGIIQVTGEGAARCYTLDPSALEFLAGMLAGLGQRARSWRDVVTIARREDGMHIRDAAPDDAAAIATIYNQGIEDRVATLETMLRTPEERAEWMAARGPRHPVLVAEDGTTAVVGWCSLNSFNPRPAYDHVADISVYVARERRGRGIGDTMLSALEQRARAIGYHKLVLAAFPTNSAGMRLYERHGFLTVGIYREQGMLDGRWVDVIVMDKLLS
jgi:L-amino acid N-acyltransferase YncA/DNA-binding transcriptional ArsR family regulator